MKPSSLLKVTGAFAAGVILTLGGALVYIKTTTVKTIAAPAPLVIPSTPAKASLPAPAVVPPPPAPVIKHVKQVRPKSVPVTVAPMVVPVAQALPPAPVLPPPAAIPARPAVNEGQGPMGPQLGTPAPAAVPPAPHVVTLQSGTNLNVRLAETVSTDRKYAGDTFLATLETPLVIDGFIIADKGSKVLGKIAGAQKTLMQLTVTEINTTDGQRVPVETSVFERRAEAKHGQDAAKIGGGAALGAIIGAIAGGGKGAAIGAGAGAGAGTGAVLLGRNKSISLPAETQLTFQLARPVTITEKLN
ncbi:MAG TPA: hypothetical protein VGK64_13495 [Bryobacteraceae bacterium]